MAKMTRSNLINNYTIVRYVRKLWDKVVYLEETGSLKGDKGDKG